MTQEERFVQHKRSNVVNKIPAAEQLRDGEIAVNYAKGSEALYIKNDKDEVKEFSTHRILRLNATDAIEVTGETSSTWTIAIEKDKFYDYIDNVDKIIIEYEESDGQGGTAKVVVAQMDRTYLTAFTGFYGLDNDIVHGYFDTENFSFVYRVTSVNNTDYSDEIKTIQNELESKQDKLVSGTNIKTINGTSLLGNGDIQTDYTIYSSEFQGSTISQSTYDLIKEVYKSNSKHLYIRDTEPLAATKGIEACIETSMGETYTVSWHVADFFESTRHFKYYRYRINNETLAIIDNSFDSLVPFSGATSSKDGEAGAVPAPLKGDKDKFLKGDGTWADIDANCYYLPVSAFSEQTAVTQTVFDAIVDVRNSNGKKHLYIYDENTTIGGVAEASVANFWGTAYYYVSWFVNYTTNTSPNVWMYRITSSSKSITNYSYQIRQSFSGATSSSAGKLGMVPAPTTADTESFLCGNGKWTKITAGNSSFNIAPILNETLTEANYNSLKDAIQKGQPIYFTNSDSAQTQTVYVSASILSGGTTSETINLFLNDYLTVGNWNPSEAKTSFETTYVPIQGAIYQIKKSDRVLNLGGYIYNQPMLSSGYNIKKINGQNLLLSTADMTGDANLEISGSFALDPNNFKFTELASAVLAHKPIVFDNWLYFTGCVATNAWATDGSDLVTDASKVKDVYIQFIFNFYDTDNAAGVFLYAIKCDNNNKWTWCGSAAGIELMKLSDYTVDSSMSDSSTNPVQNKVIKAYIDGLVGNVAAQLAEI